MLPQEVIRRKRDGSSLTTDEVKDFITGLTSGAVSEGQVAAFAMAVFFRGMSREEAVGLTLAMRDSGTVLKWDLPGPVVDKHSSGGIGDNLSLMLGPMLAACRLRRGMPVQGSLRRRMHQVGIGCRPIRR